MWFSLMKDSYQGKLFLPDPNQVEKEKYSNQALSTLPVPSKVGEGAGGEEGIWKMSP